MNLSWKGAHPQASKETAAPSPPPLPISPDAAYMGRLGSSRAGAGIDALLKPLCSASKYSCRVPLNPAGPCTQSRVQQAVHAEAQQMQLPHCCASNER